MRVLILVLFCGFGFLKAQQKDSVKAPKMPLTLPNKVFDLSKVKNLRSDSLANNTYKILNKKPDTRLYKMPVKNVKTGNLLALKNNYKGIEHAENFENSLKRKKITELKEKK